MAEKKRSCLGRILIFLLILAIIGLVGFNYLQKKDTTNKSSPNLFQRKVSMKDIEIDEKYSFPIDVKLEVTPTCDISDLEIQITFYDTHKNILTTEYYSFGDVKSGRHYDRTIRLTDLDIEAFLANSCTYTVSRGVTSLF